MEKNGRGLCGREMAEQEEYLKMQVPHQITMLEHFKDELELQDFYPQVISSFANNSKLTSQLLR